MKTLPTIQAKPACVTSAARSLATGLLQRKCACGGTPGPGGECESCRRKRATGLLQRSARTDSTMLPAAAGVPEIVHEVLRSPGQPLDATARADMEPRFGHDFSHVRIHADARAGASAQAVNAEAYTVGHHVVFAPRQFQVQTEPGRRLIAHELTHVVQQSRRDFATGGPLTVGRSDDAREFEAEQAAASLSHHNSVNPLAALPVATEGNILRRKCPPPKKEFDLASSPIGQRISEGLGKVTVPSRERDVPPQPQVNPSLVLGLLASSNCFLRDAASAQQRVPGLKFDFFSEDPAQANEFSPRDSLIRAEVSTVPRTAWRIVHEVVHASKAPPAPTGATNKAGAVTQTEEAGVREESNTRARENEIMEEIRTSPAWPRESGVEPTPSSAEDVRNSFRSGTPKLTYQEGFIIAEMQARNQIEGANESAMRALARTLLPGGQVEAKSAAKYTLDRATLSNRRETAKLPIPPDALGFGAARTCLRQYHVKAHDRSMFPTEKDSSPACLALLRAVASYPPPISDADLRQLLMELTTKNEIKTKAIQDSSALIAFLDRVPEKNRSRATRLLEWVIIAEAMSDEWQGRATPDPVTRNRHLDFLQACIGKDLTGIARPPASASERKQNKP